MADRSAPADRAADDLRAIERVLIESHPGLHAGLRDRLQAAARLARDRLPQVRTEAAYRALLRGFVSGLDDNHTAIRFADEASEPLAWVGFLAQHRHRRYVVTGPGDAAGAELVACDGRAPAQLVPEVLAFSSPAWRSAAAPVWAAPYLLIDERHPWRTRPLTCTLRRVHRTWTVPLAWQPTTRGALAEHIRAAQFGTVPSPGVRWLAGGGLWVRVPTFFPRGAPERAALEAVIAAVGAERRPWLVIDLRGNDGGSSDWGLRLAEAVVGSGGQDAGVRVIEEPGSVEWRTSADNLAYVRAAIPRLRSRLGTGSDTVADFEAVAAADDRAPLYRQAETTGPRERAMRQRLREYRRRILVLIDGRCVSACLDFVELMSTAPAVTIIGHASGCDSPYSETRQVSLRGGAVILAVPMKLYRRPDGSLRTRCIEPAHWYHGDFDDEAALEAWVRSLR